MTDHDLKEILNRSGIGETLYEGDIGERNMATWHKLADSLLAHYARKQDNTEKGA